MPIMTWTLQCIWKVNLRDIIMHHETSAAVRTYDQQLDTAFQPMRSLDLHMVKTGYVGPGLIPGRRDTTVSTW